MEIRYSDDTQMPYGYHQGKKLKDVPPGYLLLIYESRYNNKPTSGYPLSEYIHKNIDKLKISWTKQKELQQ